MTFKDLEIKIAALIDGIVKKSTMDDVANMAKDMVVERTSKGFGVKVKEGPKERLKGLSESYKKQRRRLKKQGKLATETTPNKSNLTKSRQMLDSVAAKASTGQATVYLNNDKAGKKAEYQASEGREFMNLSKSEVNKIKKFIEEKIISDIKKKGL